MMHCTSLYINELAVVRFRGLILLDDLASLLRCDTLHPTLCQGLERVANVNVYIDLRALAPCHWITTLGQPSGMGKKLTGAGNVNLLGRAL